MRRGLAKAVAAAMLVTAVFATSVVIAPGASAQLRRERMLEKVNHARVQRGIHRLRMEDYVVTLAREHNLAMARQDRLFHTTDLGTKLTGRVRWHVWGENIGAGTSVDGLFKAYMASPDHRANILDRRFDHVGISFVVRDGVMWSTMIFYG